jgi:hypothetical protein
MSVEGGQDDFFSGTSGLVFGVRATTKAVLADAGADAVSVLTGRPWRLPRAARAWPRRRILAIGVERTDVPNLMSSAREELLRSRHDITFASTAAGDRGRFQNLNGLLATNRSVLYDWVIVIDDDVALPRGFLDSFIFLAERFGFSLAQPAHIARSHAAWQVTRRQPGIVARETAFVEIGPLVAFNAVVFDALLPFPELRIGWGLDLHWSAVARERGWKIGVVDATPLKHGLRRTASAYDRRDAVAETRQFLASRPYTTATEAQRTLVTYRSWT